MFGLALAGNSHTCDQFTADDNSITVRVEVFKKKLQIDLKFVPRKIC